MAYTSTQILTEIQYRLPFGITSLAAPFIDRIVRSALQELNRVHQHHAKNLLINILDIDSVEILRGYYYDPTTGEDTSSEITIRKLASGDIYTEGLSSDTVMVHFTEKWTIDTAMADKWTQESFLDFVTGHALIAVGERLTAGEVIEGVPFQLNGPDTVDKGTTLISDTKTFLIENALWPTV